MKHLSLSSVLFISILLLGIFFRIFRIDSVPPSPSLDEVSLGYNAYSILQTGKDEYGTTYPLILRAYDDFRPALYIYLIIPFLFFFDLSVFAIRFPSVLLSISSLFLTFFLAKYVIPEKVKVFRDEMISTKYSPHLVILFLAISPWHIYISRLGHEVNLAFFLYLSGILSFFVGVKRKQHMFFLLSTTSFILSMYAYQSEKLLAPITFFTLLVLFHKQVFQMKKYVLFGGFFAIILSIPMILSLSNPQVLQRLQGTSDFTSANHLYHERAVKLLKAKEEGNVIGEVFYNRRFTPLIITTHNYVSHFHPNWLIKNLYDDNHKIPDLGLLFPWELPLIIIGMLTCLCLKDKRVMGFLFIWLLISPLPASITTDAPHVMRTYTVLPLPQIFISIGLVALFSLVKNRVYQLLIGGIMGVLLLVSIVTLYTKYFYHLPYIHSSSFQYPLSQALLFVTQQEKNFSRIYISHELELTQSYMHYLYTVKYDPNTYQQEGGTGSGGFAQRHKIGKYFFGKFNYNKHEKGSMYVGNPKSFPRSVHPKKVFTNMKGEKSIYVVY